MSFKSSLKSSLKDKRRRALIGGIMGLSVGFWMIFIVKDNFGFLPAILGSLLLLLRR